MKVAATIVSVIWLLIIAIAMAHEDGQRQMCRKLGGVFVGDTSECLFIGKERP